MRHRGAERTRSQWDIPRMSVIRLSFCSENFHIFHKGRAKTLLICMCQLLNVAHLEIFSRKTIQLPYRTYSFLQSEEAFLGKFGTIKNIKS